MKVVISVCLVAMAAVALAHPHETDRYTERYDNIDLEEFLSNDKLVTKHVGCLLDTIKNCPPENKELKSHLKEALEDGCARCSEKQISGARKVIGFLINNRPEDWKLLAAKFDPEGKFSKKYEEELKKIKN